MTDADAGEAMIPRITVRDSDDAMMLLLALRIYAHDAQDAIRREAGKPGADQYALSLRMIETTESITGLMTAITDGIVKDSTENPTENKD